MLFNSLHFLVFLPIVFAAYWLAAPRGPRVQNALLLLASWYFYACWDVRFLALLLFSTLLDYVSGIRISAATGKTRRAWLWASVLINLGFLLVFKYYDFFVSSFAANLARAGLSIHPQLLKVVIPVGISFYTFHGLSYVFDCYRERIGPERNFITYALFVAFFPLLVAGPIERATHLLPQLRSPRVFRYRLAIEGLRQMLWGFFKKLAIADGCALIVNMIFGDEVHYNSGAHWMGAFFFAIQIYCDFSGYTDIALGAARLFGFDLLQNFHYPYFARDIAEFWRRWHISLSRWFRDYLYIPLGGSKAGRSRTVRNTLIVFLISGLWHGARWNFIAWGGLHALFFMPLLLTGRNRKHLDVVAHDRHLPRLSDAGRILLTFTLVTIAWIPFRAPDMGAALSYWAGCIHGGTRVFFWKQVLVPETLLTLFLISVEWTGRRHSYALAGLEQRMPWLPRWLFYALLLFLIGMNMVGDANPFIYFQF
jgi:alginate O-acetyltransferase complex protein AlgI